MLDKLLLTPFVLPCEVPSASTIPSRFLRESVLRMLELRPGQLAVASQWHRYSAYRTGERLLRGAIVRRQASAGSSFLMLPSSCLSGQSDDLRRMSADRDQVGIETRQLRKRYRAGRHLLQFDTRGAEDLDNDLHRAHRPGLSEVTFRHAYD